MGLNTHQSHSQTLTLNHKANDLYSGPIESKHQQSDDWRVQSQWKHKNQGHWKAALHWRAWIMQACVCAPVYTLRVRVCVVWVRERTLPAGMVYPITCHQCFCQSAKKSPRCPSIVFVDSQQWTHTCEDTHTHTNTHTHCSWIHFPLICKQRTFTHKHVNTQSYILSDLDLELGAIYKWLSDLPDIQRLREAYVLLLWSLPPYVPERLEKH